MGLGSFGISRFRVAVELQREDGAPAKELGMWANIVVIGIDGGSTNAERLRCLPTNRAAGKACKGLLSYCLSRDLGISGKRLR